MAHFMLLLYENPAGWAALSPEEMQKAVEKYIAWSKKPFMVDSKRLDPSGVRTVRPQADGPARVTDGPFSESKEVVGGYYTIEAADYDQAVERVQDHPHLAFGGTVEIVKVWGS
jgi:hypothetical protein